MKKTSRAAVAVRGIARDVEIYGFWLGYRAPRAIRRQLPSLSISSGYRPRWATIGKVGVFPGTPLQKP